MSMRVIGGSHRGRPLALPLRAVARPTSDRTREAVFNMLGPLSRGCRVLDLCAGSGAMAIEALSRGAGWADLVDIAGSACAIIRRNLESLGMSARASVHRADAPTWLRFGPETPPYDLVFADPPYDSELLSRIAEALGARGDRTAVGARVVFEAASEDMPTPPVNMFRCLRARRYGRAFVALFERTASEPGGTV